MPTERLTDAEIDELASEGILDTLLGAEQDEMTLQRL